VSRAVEAARAVSVANDRRILHVLPRHFVVDGQEGVRDAVGMSGSRLEVETHIITGANTAIQNVVKVMHEAGLDVDDLVLQVLASAESVITEDEMERGVVVVDIGGGTTDVAVFAHGSILHSGVIPVGGNHVTSDLAVGLRCDLDTAEEVKRLYGHCLQLSIPADQNVTLTPIGYEDPIVVPQRYLAEIIGPRAREIAQLIVGEIEKTGPSALYSAGIVLTGGSAQLRGFAEVVQQVTDLPARMAGPTGLSGMDTEMRGPAYSTAVGLLRWGGRLHSGGHVQLMGRRQRPKNINGNSTTSWHINAATNFTRWLRELF
jgi:cell division protein FtsA